MKGDSIHRISKLVCRLTLYGKVEAKEVDINVIETIRKIIPVYTFSCLRRYNLEEGLMLMRSMNYLRMKKDEALKQAIDFMLLQQNQVGRFGFYASEIRRSKVSDPKFDEVSKLYLPLTVSSMWTFGELINSNFSLFNSVRS